MNLTHFKTPSELIEIYPECGWNPRQIGYLLMLGMVEGKKIPNSCLISVTSFEAAMLHKAHFGCEPLL